MTDDAFNEPSPGTASGLPAEVAIRRLLAESSHLAARVATLHGLTAVDDRGDFARMTLAVEAKRWPAERAHVHVSEPNVCPLLRVTAAEAEQLAVALLVAAEAAREMDATPLVGEHQV